MSGVNDVVRRFSRSLSLAFSEHEEHQPDHHLWAHKRRSVSEVRRIRAKTRTKRVHEHVESAGEAFSHAGMKRRNAFVGKDEKAGGQRTGGGGLETDCWINKLVGRKY